MSRVGCHCKICDGWLVDTSEGQQHRNGDGADWRAHNAAMRRRGHVRRRFSDSESHARFASSATGTVNIGCECPHLVTRGDSFPRNLGIGLGLGLGLHDVLSPSSFAVSVVLMDTPVRTSYGPHPQRPHWHRLPNKAKTRLNTPHGVMCFYHVPTVGLRARRCALGLDVAFSTTVRRKNKNSAS